MNSKFINTLYFKEDNILGMIHGVHRANRLVQQELTISTKQNNLTNNEFLLMIQIHKGFEKKIELSNKLLIKKQNINLIFKSLEEKNLIKDLNNKVILSEKGNELFQKVKNNISKKIINLFKKIDAKNMSGLINVVDNL